MRSLMIILLAKYYSGYKIEKNEVGGACRTFGREENCDRFLVGKPEEKRQLGRTRRKWEDNIKMDLQEVGWVCGTDWIDLSQYRDR
jgi:hypothetical protein